MAIPYAANDNTTSGIRLDKCVILPANKTIAGLILEKEDKACNILKRLFSGIGDEKRVTSFILFITPDTPRNR
jgi:hypothetical protein